MYIPMRFVPGSTQRFQVLTILAFFILGRLSEASCWWGSWPGKKRYPTDQLTN